MKVDKKKIFIIGGILLVVAVLIIGTIFLLKPSKKDKKEEEKIYTMYVKINPLVKLTFKEVVVECEDEKGDKTVCSGNITNEIIDYELINNDAKTIYNKLDFKGKEVIDVLVELCDTARENNIGFESLEITSDWEDVYDEETIKNALKESGKYEYDVHVYVDFKEYIEEDKILDKEEPEEEVLYLVKFDSNGGSKVIDQVLKENEKAVVPEQPIREGYTFIEWQLDGKKYDFDSTVNKDITLKAKWEKIKEEPPVEEQKPETPNEPAPPVEEPKEEEKEPENTTNVTSTLDRINLNDNLLVTYGMGGTLCGNYYFITNFETVYPDYANSYDRDRKYVDLFYYPDFDSKINEFTFDAAKEEHAKNVLSSINTNNVIGVVGYNYGDEGHGIRYSFHSIELYDHEKYGTFGQQFADSQRTFFNNFNGLFDDAYYVSGGCGYYQEPELLTQELCDEYSLTCDRW